MLPIHENDDNEDDNGNDDENGNTPLETALRAVGEIEDNYLTVVPREPSEAMLKAAALVADVSLETARLVYKAMLWAASGHEDPPPVDD